MSDKEIIKILLDLTPKEINDMCSDKPDLEKFCTNNDFWRLKYIKDIGYYPNPKQIYNQFMNFETKPKLLIIQQSNYLFFNYEIVNKKENTHQVNFKIKKLDEKRVSFYNPRLDYPNKQLSDGTEIKYGFVTNNDLPNLLLLIDQYKKHPFFNSIDFCTYFVENHNTDIFGFKTLLKQI